MRVPLLGFPVGAGKSGASGRTFSGTGSSLGQLIGRVCVRARGQEHRRQLRLCNVTVILAVSFSQIWQNRWKSEDGSVWSASGRSHVGSQCCLAPLSWGRREETQASEVFVACQTSGLVLVSSVWCPHRARTC